MANPRGVNQYSAGKHSGTFHLGTKSKNSSNAVKKTVSKKTYNIKPIVKRAKSSKRK